mmetsp:Transcript_26932/g.22217  ORF Transcript_26932/g.22217 Transcript_26932/m.22217 type:complete len:135 (+) Transcript_26932:3-407(+)
MRLLMVIHSLSYIFCPQYSFWRLLSNLADLALFGGLGVAGMIAELWPRDSKAHKVIRTVLPFMTSFVGRALFYIVIGMLCSGNGANGIGKASSSSTEEFEPPLPPPLGCVNIIGADSSSCRDENVNDIPLYLIA